MLNNFTIAVYFEKMFIDIYWKLISEIKNKKRVKVHSSLVSRLQKCKEIKESKQINIESDNYIRQGFLYGFRYAAALFLDGTLQ